MYTSTRMKKAVTASSSIIEGISQDGGLYVLDNIPKIDLSMLMDKNYQEMAQIILELFLDDYTKEEIASCINQAYQNRFRTNEVVEIKETKDCFFLELYHGPTLAFKDVALTILPYLLKTAKEKNGITDKTTILTATSGDTGSAALSGFSSIPGIDIMVFYPDGGVSQIQEQQMLSFESKSAHTFAVKGNFDDCQTFVKKVFSEGYKGLSSANSINVGRLVPQVVYYFYAYFDLVKKGSIKMGDKINFCVPTGNFGDILAGYYALEMGLPINKLICASNINKVLTDFFQTGIYDKRREFLKTISPSMDILISSNLERLLYYVTRDTEEVKRMMEELKQTGKYQLKDIDKLSMFYAGYADDQDSILTIRKEFFENNYVIDPHTAVAKTVYDEYVLKTKDQTKTVVLSTASPFKFIKSIAKALEMNDDNEFALIDEASKKCQMPIPEPIKAIRNNLKEKHSCTLKDADSYLKENL